MIDRDLIVRALDGAELVEAAYHGAGAIRFAGGRVLRSYARRGIEAYVVRWRGRTWVAAPGTDSWLDWLRDLLAQVPWYARGEWRALGFHLAADPLTDWAQRFLPYDGRLHFAGHSLGAALVALSVRDLENDGRDVEAHAYGQPGVVYGRVLHPTERVHSWLIRDDQIRRLPIAAGRLGALTELGKVDLAVDDHRIRHYVAELRALLGREEMPDAA